MSFVESEWLDLWGENEIQFFRETISLISLVFLRAIEEMMMGKIRSVRSRIYLCLCDMCNMCDNVGNQISFFCMYVK